MNYAERFDQKLSHDSPVSIGGERFSFESKSVFLQPNDSTKAVVVPDAHLLFSGEYTRIGNDLIISGSDQKFVVGNYFKGESRPILATKDGATLSGHIVDALTGHVHYAQANAPAAAEVIGHVLKLSGSATAIRNGVSIELHIGDAVQKGDVIQTGADSSIGMTFVDGSAFGMTSNARMVLNEMIFDPNGSSNSSLISLVQGTITFVAGQTAKNGNMRVETPVATMGIRGTAVLVEIASDDGPTKFSVLVEPDGHTGSYNLYDKVTGQLIGTVSQAGQVTFVSSLGLGQPPSAVEQLKTMQDQQAEKAIIQQVFQLYFPNYNPDSKPNAIKFGSTSGNNLAEIIVGTATFGGQVSITQIELRFVPADGNGGGNQTTNKIFYNTKAAFSADAVYSSQTFVMKVEQFKIADVVKIDDPDIGNAPFFDIPTPFVAGSAVVKSAVSTIPYLDYAFLRPLLVIDQDTGVVSFDRLKFNFLGEGESVTFEIQVVSKSGPDAALVTIPITITGSNDAPTIVSGPMTKVADGVIEDTHVNSSGALASDGVITFKDVDLTDTHTASVALTSTSSDLPGFVNNTTHIGTFTIGGVPQSTSGSVTWYSVSESNTDTSDTGTVSWNFTLPDNDPTLQSLAEGETITQIYTITIKDQHGVEVPQTVTITITGTNDIPVITAGVSQTDTIYEVPGQTGQSEFDTNANGDTPGGVITFTDIDLTDRPKATTTEQTILYLSADDGEGHHEDLSGTLTEAQIAAIKDAFVLSQAGNTNNGTVNWTYKLSDDALDFMAQGETIKLVSTVEIDDHHGGKVLATVTINIIGGSNDTPEITSSANTVALTELPTDLHETFTVDFTDVDLTQTGHTASVTSVELTGPVPPGTSPGQVYTSGNAFLDLLTVAAPVVKNSGESAGHATFVFDAGPGVFDYLAKDEVVTLTYTVRVTDSLSTYDEQTITVTVKGTNDAPEIGTIDSTTLNEQTDTSALTLNTPLHVTFTDVDLDNIGHTADITDVTKAGVTTGLTLTTAQLIGLVTPVSIEKAFGSSSGSVDLGFSAASTYFDYLAAGESVTLTYTLSVDDHAGGVTTKTFDVKIVGTNDDAVVSVGLGDSDMGAVTEDQLGGTETTSGTLTFSDVDLSDHHDIDATPIGTTLGTLTATKVTDTSGGTGGKIAWSYTVPDSAIQYLAAGEEKIEKFNVTVFDGTSMVTKEISITIHGANDAPVIVADETGTGGTNVHDIPETNSGLTASGTLAVSDADISNTVSASVFKVVVSGTGAASLPTALDNAALKAMLSVDLGNVISNTDTDGTIHWSFDSDGNPFNFLADGETLTLTYTIQATDSDSTHATADQTVVIQINGTNDAPVVAAALTDSATKGGSEFTRDLLTGASDVDHNDVLHVDNLKYSVDGGTPSSDIPPGLMLAADGYTLIIDPNNEAFNGLAEGQQKLIVVSYDVIDSHDASVHQTETITIKGNDPPTVGDDNFIVASDAFNTDGLTQTSTLTIADALLLLNDSDTPGQMLTVTGVEDGSVGTVTHASDTTFSIDTLPASGVSPPYSFQYTVADSVGAATVGMVNVTIAAADAADPAHHTLTSTSANEIFIGGPGGDSFVFTANSGNDTIANFQTGTDQIVLNDYGDPFGPGFSNWLELAVNDTANGAVIHLDANNSITLTGVTKANLSASDFLIHPGGVSA